MRKALKQYRFPILAILPFFLSFIIFQLIPVIWTIYISFHNWDGLRPPRWIGWGNYTQMFQDYMFHDALRNTAIYLVVGIVGVLGCAMMIALLIKSRSLKFKSAFKTATFLPYVCASVAMGLIFGMLFDQNAGLLNAIIVALGGEAQPWLTSSRLARIPVHTLFIWRTTPWYTLILLSGLLGIPEEYYEAARVDGASAFQQFFKITLPQLGHILFFCSVTIIVDIGKIFNEPYTLPGPGTSNTSLFQLMYESGFTIFKLGYASAQGVVLTLALLAISLIQFRMRRLQGEV